MLITNLCKNMCALYVEFLTLFSRRAWSIMLCNIFVSANSFLQTLSWWGTLTTIGQALSQTLVHGQCIFTDFEIFHKIQTNWSISSFNLYKLFTMSKLIYFPFASMAHFWITFILLGQSLSKDWVLGKSLYSLHIYLCIIGTNNICRRQGKFWFYKPLKV